MSGQRKTGPTRASASKKPSRKGGNRARSATGGGWSWGRFFRIGLVTALVFVIIGALGFVYVYSSTTIPTPNKDFQTQTTNVYYKDGKTGLGRFVEQNRESIPFAQMPKHVRDAVVAAEDRTFWTNRGIDPKGILRAAFSNAKGGSTQGASTITQQYVKIYYLSSERTFKRKIKEAFVSLKLQKQLTKSKILEGYLNTIYFGRGAYGIQAAAQAYFGVDAKDLTVKQGAVLASVLNSPQSFDPAEGPDARQRLLGRYRYTLSGMAKMGTLDAAKADQLSAKLPAFPTFKRAQTYSGQKGFMLEMVKNELHQLGYNDDTIDGGGLRVTTTFAKPVMRAIRNGVHAVQPKGLKQLHTGAVSLDNETGAVRGIFGGQDYLKSPFNWALKGGQPGSSFKPFALAAGIKDGFSLKDTFQGNSPYVFPDGSEVKNEGGGSGSQLRGEDQPDHGHRAVGQHRLHRPDRLDGQRSQEDRRHGHRPRRRHQEVRHQADLRDLPGFRAGRHAGHGQRVLDDRQRRRGAPVVRRGEGDPRLRRQDALQGASQEEEGARPRHRGRHVLRAAAGGHQRHRAERQRDRQADGRQDRHRDQRQGPGVELLVHRLHAADDHGRDVRPG